MTFNNLETPFSELRRFLGFDFADWPWSPVSAVLLGLSVHGLLRWIDLYIWSPAAGYLIVMALTLADFALGAGFAFFRCRYRTRLALRGVCRLVAYTGLLAAAHGLARYDPLLAWLPETVFFPLSLILFTSLVRRLAGLGLLPHALADQLTRRVDAVREQSPPPVGTRS
jgi:hypothetical protein